MINLSKNLSRNIKDTIPSSIFYNTSEDNSLVKNIEKESNIFSKTFTEGFKQSPKITSQKTRNIYYIRTPKLFSLRDINDKITDSRGTSLPSQYKRLSEEEINNLFGVNYTLGWNYDQTFMKKIRENTNKIRNNFRKLRIPKSSLTININNNNNNRPLNTFIDKNLENKKEKPEIIKIKKIENKEENKNESTIENELKNIEEIKIKKIYENKEPLEMKIPNKKRSRNEKSENEKNKNYNTISTPESFEINIKNKISKTNSFIEIRNRNDKWLPKGYEDYEKIVKNPKLLKRQISTNNPFVNKLPDLKLSDIKKKSIESDIFFRKIPDQKEDEYNYKLLNYNDHQNSDIFIQKNDLTSIFKNSETYLFKPKKKENYSNSRESNSEWMSQTKIPTLLNHVSTEYNILNPNIKNFSKLKTEILNECENKKNINSVNCFNPIYRQKSLCEFIDLTRNGAPNPGKDYLSSYNKSNDAFRIRNDICSSFGDSYNSCKNLLNKPFINDKFS